jgi:hypothetical protein
MENPAEWKQAEKVISDAFAEWTRLNRAGTIGLSLPGLTAARLREAGVVSDAEEPALGWEGLRQEEPQEFAALKPKPGRRPRRAELLREPARPALPPAARPTPPEGSHAQPG